jgi:hypothetical protein
MKNEVQERYFQVLAKKADKRFYIGLLSCRLFLFQQ